MLIDIITIKKGKIKLIIYWWQNLIFCLKDISFSVIAKIQTKFLLNFFHNLILVVSGMWAVIPVFFQKLPIITIFNAIDW